MNDSSDKVEVKIGSKLNVNAPIFEPKKVNNVNFVNEDGINRKGNLKSTMLVPPQRQQIINFPAYMCHNQIQYPMQIDCNDGTFTIVNLPAGCTEPSQPVVNDTVFTMPVQKPIMSNKNDNPTTTSEHNGTSVAYLNSSNTGNYVVSMSTSSTVPSINAGIMPLIMSQTNQSPVIWHGCAPSPSVALIPSPCYPPMNNMYLIRPPMYTSIAPIHIQQNKSHLKTNIRNKVFNTGDTEQDKILNNIVKTINPLDEFVFRSKNCRFFVIKSFTEDNIYQAIRHSVWCSTPGGNDTLVMAYKHTKQLESVNDESTEAHVYLFFSVNGSGYFCGVAEMTSDLNHNTGANIWNQKKWQAQFSIRWLYIKDVPNSYLRHIKLESNDNRPVTNCRDATEILPLEKGIEVLRIIHNLDYETCLLNDFNQDSGKIDKG